MQWDSDPDSDEKAKYQDIHHGQLLNHTEKYFL